MCRVHRAGDEVHLVHVVHGLERSNTHAAPPVDVLPQRSIASLEAQAAVAERFIQTRFLSQTRGLGTPPIVHLAQVSDAQWSQAATISGPRLVNYVDDDLILSVDNSRSPSALQFSEGTL